MFLKTLRFFVIFTVTTGGFFIFEEKSLAADTDIVINEIGAYEPSDHEWIEIYNRGSAPVDLTGWKFYEDATNHGLAAFRGDFVIEPGEYAIIADVATNFQTDYPSFTGTIIDSSWTTLNESGEAIALKDAAGNIIESFTYINATNYSLERADPNLADYTFSNWREHASGNTAGSQNSNYGLPPGPVCGNSVCESGENFLTCPADCSAPPSEPSVGDIVINEFVSDPAEGNEWIEIYNNQTFDINLSDWILEDGVGTIATLSGTLMASGTDKFKIFEMSSNRLNNDGDIIKLKKSDGTIIDQVAYGNWNDGNISDNAPKANDPNSTARNFDGNDTDNNLSDFSVTSTLTKGTSNIITAPPAAPGSSSPPEDTSPPSPPSWPVGTLLINEFVSDPADGGNEWIELYNPTNLLISLTDWAVEDGAETVTALSGNIASFGFYVLEKPKGILNNTGDLIILKDPAGTIIDQVSYGDWDDGEKSDNAPAATDPNSVARISDGQDTNNDFNDFIVSSPTRGTTNSGGTQKDSSGTYPRDLIINEVLPNPKGNDGQNEFIELKNIGTTDIDLTDWKVGDASTKRYTVKTADFTSTTLKPNEFFVLYRKTTGLALNNSGTEQVKLFGPDGTLITSIEYTGAVAEDNSYARKNTEYFWTTTPTPEKENIITKVNQAPKAVISVPDEAEINELITFDASDSIDPDNDALNFSWNFGDGNLGQGENTNHTYQKKGKYKIILTVKDTTGAAATAQQYIKIIESETNETADENPTAGEPPIVVSEALPNPAGSDEAEWIELYNPSNESFDLSGWKLDDDEGGSRPYKIPEGTIIGPDKYLVFKKSETKLALNNTSDAVRLLDPDGEIFFETNYDDVAEGASWARDDDGSFKWTTKFTPGGKNIFRFQEKTAAKKSSSKKITSFAKTTLDEIRNFDLNDGIKVQGQVISEPGILGTQIFYIADAEACPGIQIYMYKKDFPKLALGDLVEVSGVLSESGGEKRIKVAAKNDIKVLEQKNVPAPLAVKLNEVDESLEGCLVTAAGEVTEKSGSNLYLGDDDGELRVYFKSTLAFPKPKIKIGENWEITGIVSQTKTGFRLLPRYENDLKIKPPAETEDLSAAETPAETGGNNINLYLGAASGLLGLTLVGLGLKTGTFSTWWKKFKGL